MSHMSALTKTLAAIAILAAANAPSASTASPLNPANHACFFNGVGFTGDVVCFYPNARQIMPAGFASSISSIQVIGNVAVTLCTGFVNRGTCKTFVDDTWQVPSPLHNNAKSFQIEINHTDHLAPAPAMSTKPSQTMLPIVGMTASR